MFPKILALIVGAIFATSLVLIGVSEAKDHKESQTSGRALYMANCEACHIMGMNVIKPGKEIVKSDKLASEKIFRDFLSEKHGIMPPFNDIASNDELSSKLYKFVRKLKKQSWEYHQAPIEEGKNNNPLGH